MAPLFHHLLLALAVLALGAAAGRLASLAAPGGLERAVAAAVLAAGAAAAESLLLGLVGLGGSTAALTLAALATWLAAWLLLPAARVSPAQELRDWWLALTGAQRALLGAALGAGAAWAAWLIRYPALGHDMVLYHLPEALIWVHRGHPGAVEQVVAGLPVGSYPVTHEVLLAWAMGISHSLLAVTLLTIGLLTLLGVAGWVGLRALSVPRLPAALALGAVLLAPAVMASQSGGATIDPAALSWLVCCGALCAASARRPALLAPALVAAGLAGGTKTTALPLALACLAAALVLQRKRLRGLELALACGVVAALGVGGVWYLRNFASHGSPLWPFVRGPWGDPQPPLIKLASVSFLDRPGATWSRLHSYYWDHFGGQMVLLAAGMAAPLVRPTKAVAAAALATAVSILLWMNAPFTGVIGSQPTFDVGTGDATRYLMPGVAAAALALALAARRRDRMALLPLAALAAGLVFCAKDTFDLGFPSAPSRSTPLLGALAGAAVLAAAGARIAPRRLPRRGMAWAALAALALGALATPLASGYLRRHADTNLFDSTLVRWLDSRPSFTKDDQLVAVSSSVIGPLTGDRLRHPLELIGPDEPCARVAELPRRAWTVFQLPQLNGVAAGPERCLAGRRPAYEDERYRVYAPPGA